MSIFDLHVSVRFESVRDGKNQEYTISVPAYSYSEALEIADRSVLARRSDKATVTIRRNQA